LHVFSQPGADGLSDAADREMGTGFHAVVCRSPQHVDGILPGQHGKQCTRLDALARDHGIRDLRAEQQTSHASVVGNGSHDVRDSRASLFVWRDRGYRGLGGCGQIGDHPIEDTADEFVLVGEAFVEVAGSQAGPLADASDGQCGDVRPVGPQQVQTGIEQPAAPLGEPLGGLDAAVGPHARGHRRRLDTRAGYRQNQETSVFTISR